MKPDEFVHLHTHSDMSQLDGAGRISEYVEVAKERGNPAIAFTDHGTMRGYMKLHEETKAAGIKPIYGLEFYVSPDMRRRGLTDEERVEITKDLKAGERKAAIKQYEEKIGLRDRWHTTVWALDDEGLKNLYRLSSSAWIDGFYYKPRIDINELIKYGSGLAVASGCLSSPINDCWLQGKKRAALEFADRLSEVFGDRMYLEIQPHAIHDQRIANQLMLELRERYGTRHKLLATQDAHYVKQEDAPHHEVLLCIGTNSNLSDPNRFKFDGDEFFMKTRSQMRDTFLRHHEFVQSKLVKEALNSTLELAERCTASVKVDYHATLLPDPGVPDRYAGNHFVYLKDLVLDGWAWREIPKRAAVYAKRFGISKPEALKKYTERLKFELSELVRLKFVKYFLMIDDIYRFARANRIMAGPGRGSVGGSLVAYLLGIAAVDPIEHGLLFERFINPYRIDLPDVDMDFEDRRRHEIVEYVRAKYGADKVCQIATIGKLSGKQCIKDVSRVLEVPLSEVNKVTNSIIERSSGDERASQTIEDSFKEFEVCREFNKRYPAVLHHARRLEGLAKNLGIHAAGVVASPVPLTDLMPLETRGEKGSSGSKERVIVSAIDMYGVAACGLVKLDVLGLRTLTVLKEACEMIERRHGRHIDLESSEVDLNDPKVLGNFTKHDYGGVFQYDTPSADKVCAGVKFTSFEDVAAMTALNRPGTSRSGLATKYVERKKNPKLVSKVDFHEKVSEITADTLGIIVYQEHVIKIFTDIAGFAPGTADSLRKTIAKKIGDETLGKEREKFVEGAIKNTPGMTKDVANKIMDAITFFGSYGFNKSHATEYGVIAFWGMWLKTYYPLEFYWALLKNEPDRLKVQQIAKDAKRHGIELLPPHVNISQKEFAIDGERNAIRGSLVDIKGVGDNAADAIIAAQPYKSFFDFVQRIDRRRVHRGVVVALARAGALDGMIPNLRNFLENSDAIWAALTAKRRNVAKIRELLIDKSREVEDYSEEDRVLLASKVNPLAFGRHPIDAYKSFMKEHVKAKPLVTMDGDDFFKDWDGKGVYVAGVIVEVKYNQVGDFHTGELPSEEERKRQFWGRRYANVNVEDRTGKQNRFKFDWDIFDTYREIIDRGVGTPVIVHASPMAFTGTLRAHFAADLERLREHVKSATSELTIWEKLVLGFHPAITRKWESEEIRKARVWNDFYRQEGARIGNFTGVVTHVRPRCDRRGGLMATWGMLGACRTYLEVMCFASIWTEIRRTIKPGLLVRVELEKKPDKMRGGWSHFYDGGKICVYRDAKKSAAEEVAV